MALCLLTLVSCGKCFLSRNVLNEDNTSNLELGSCEKTRIRSSMEHVLASTVNFVGINVSN